VRTSEPSNTDVTDMLSKELARQRAGASIRTQAKFVTFGSAEQQAECVRQCAQEVDDGKFDSNLNKTNVAVVVLNSWLAEHKLPAIADDSAASAGGEPTPAAAPGSAAAGGNPGTLRSRGKKAASGKLKTVDPIEEQDDVREAKAAARERLAKETLGERVVAVTGRAEVVLGATARHNLLAASLDPGLDLI
jgi:hypothetical protein